MRSFISKEYVNGLLDVLDKQIAEAEHGSFNHLQLVRDKAIYCLLYYGLLRQEEIRLLTVNSFTHNPTHSEYEGYGYIKVRGMNPGRGRNIPVRDHILAQALSEYMEAACTF